MCCQQANPAHATVWWSRYFSIVHTITNFHDPRVIQVPEKRQTSQLQENIEAARQQVLRHPLYKQLQANKTSRAPALDLIRVFMVHHVWAVWDYFQLLKRLQQELTCVRLPWRPRGDAQLRRFVNEIVLEEETDLMEDGVSYGSHLELYLKVDTFQNCDVTNFFNFSGHGPGRGQG